MTQSAPSWLARQSTSKLALLILAMFALAVLIAAYPTYRFVRHFTTETLHPVAEFDSNEVFNFVDQDPYTPYYLSMSVSSRDAVLPDMDINITNAQGKVEGDPINRWNSVFGREYKQFLTIPQQSDGKLTFEVITKDHEDLLIYRRIEDVLNREINRAKLPWLISILPLVAAMSLIIVILIRMINNSSKVELHVSK